MILNAATELCFLLVSVVGACMNVFGDRKADIFVTTKTCVLLFELVTVLFFAYTESCGRNFRGGLI